MTSEKSSWRGWLRTSPVQESETDLSCSRGSSQSEKCVSRTEILRILNEDVAWLRAHARNKRRFKDPLKIQLLRASIYGCSVMLSGLKDEELELRVLDLETKLKEGILIERNKPKT